MATNSDIERWFAEGGFPLEATMRRVRAVIVGADARMSEYLKYGTLAFGYEGDFATFVQTKKKPVTLMFNRGARVERTRSPRSFPHMVGTGPSARFMRFEDTAEVEALAPELADLVVAWCEMVAPAASDTAQR